MSFTASKISYRETNAFSRIVNDYLGSVPALDPFYKYKPDIEGIKDAIRHRKSVPFDREGFVELIKAQYKDKKPEARVLENIQKLLSENCFTVTTAHQPNIFTGHLYFIYKIIHAIRLADDLKKLLPENDFVPVYYMGSEDADLEELGEISINGKIYKWETEQTGAVGRMRIDKPLLRLIDEMDGQLSVEPFGKEIIEIVRDSYKEGETIEQATFEMLHKLFAAFGLIVFLPDCPEFKKKFIQVFKKELWEQFSSPVVNETISSFPAEYRVQAAGRELNLFYLKDNVRERIEKLNSHWKVVNTNYFFREEELITELENYPERFSPNVILRPVFQEFVLPNIAFIGGGGELAYWLELAAVFEAADVPFPVLILRNSFAVIDAVSNQLVSKLNLTDRELFTGEQDLVDMFVKRESKMKLGFEEEKQKLELLYQDFSSGASAIDPTLEKHVTALRLTALKKIIQLEKKMMRAERKKFEASTRQLKKVKERLFPTGTLQERVDNLLPYYAKWGTSFIRELYNHSEGFTKNFTLLSASE